jgi:hypothetical protein
MSEWRKQSSMDGKSQKGKRKEGSGEGKSKIVKLQTELEQILDYLRTAIPSGEVEDAILIYKLKDGGIAHWIFTPTTLHNAQFMLFRELMELWEEMVIARQELDEEREE